MGTLQETQEYSGKDDSDGSSDGQMHTDSEADSDGKLRTGHGRLCPGEANEVQCGGGEGQVWALLKGALPAGPARPTMLAPRGG